LSGRSRLEQLPLLKTVPPLRGLVRRLIPSPSLIAHHLDMSSLEQRLDAFRQLSLPAQLVLIVAAKLNPEMATDRDYLEKLKRIHAQCLAAATSEQQKAYENAIEALTQ
jgi:hypothetical protein